MDSFAGQALQFIKSLQGQQAPVRKSQGLGTQTDINLRGGLAQLDYNDTVFLFQTLLIRTSNQTESLIIHLFFFSLEWLYLVPPPSMVRTRIPLPLTGSV